MSIEYSGMPAQRGDCIIYDLNHPNPLLNELEKIHKKTKIKKFKKY
jgi:hypothetical protein